MKLAVSNLALPAINHLHLLPALAEMGVGGLEIAPAHTWPDTWSELGATAIDLYRRAARGAGLTVVGLHALLAGRPELGLFKGHETRARTADFITHLSAVCRDLGGNTLVLGSRWRGDIRERDAWVECRAFLDTVLPRIEGHGTKLCLAPLTPDDGDFCATARQCRILAYALDDHPALGLHLGAAAVTANGEMGHATFAGLRGRLDHFHADEPGLDVVGSTGRVDHPDLRRHLAAISYGDWVSLVQRPSPAPDPLADLRCATQFASGCYLPVDAR